MSSSVAPTVSSQAEALQPRKHISAQGVLLPQRGERYSSSGIWVAIFAITMSFAAFSSALFVREGTADWGHLVLPSILYVNTLILVCSSVTLEMARRCIGEQENRRQAGAWVMFTLLLGLGFCVGQYCAWLDLRSEGIYLATNPNSSFFYLLTVLHALHVCAGIAGLTYLAVRLISGRGRFRTGFFRNTAIYWHFMSVLWLYLLLLCRVKL
jgi:cytochrome c oxidase subunit III